MYVCVCNAFGSRIYSCSFVFVFQHTLLSHTRFNRAYEKKIHDRFYSRFVFVYCQIYKVRIASTLCVCVSFVHFILLSYSHSVFSFLFFFTDGLVIFWCTVILDENSRNGVPITVSNTYTYICIIHTNRLENSNYNVKENWSKRQQRASKEEKTKQIKI